MQIALKLKIKKSLFLGLEQDYVIQKQKHKMCKTNVKIIFLLC
jgi:hypothetical protein